MKSSSCRTMRQCELGIARDFSAQRRVCRHAGDLLTFVTFGFRQKHELRSPDQFSGYRKLPSACGSGH